MAVSRMGGSFKNERQLYGYERRLQNLGAWAVFLVFHSFLVEKTFKNMENALTLFQNEETKEKCFIYPRTYPSVFNIENAFPESSKRAYQQFPHHYCCCCCTNNK